MRRYMAISLSLFFLNCYSIKNNPEEFQTFSLLNLDRGNIEKIIGFSIEKRSVGGYIIDYYYDLPNSCNWIRLNIVDNNQHHNYWDSLYNYEIDIVDYNLKAIYVKAESKKDSQEIALQSKYFFDLSVKALTQFRKMHLKAILYECNKTNEIIQIWRDTSQYIYLKDTVEYFKQLKIDGDTNSLIRIENGLYKYKGNHEPDISGVSR